MKIIQHFIVIIFLIKIVTSRLQFERNIYSNNLPNTYDALILKFCKKDYDTILVSDDSKKIDLHWLQNLQTQFSVISHRNLKTYNNNLEYTKKVDAFVLITKSEKKLANSLENLRKIVWWNVMTPVYILNIPANDCKISLAVLRRMWSRKILTSYFLCSDINKEIQIYTYNPFTNRAPSQWTFVRTLEKEQYWTLYKQKYVAGDLCEKLDFDRTKILNGYQIIVACPPLNSNYYSRVVRKFYYYNAIHRYRNIIMYRDKTVIDTLTTLLNVMVRIYFFSSLSSNEKYLKHMSYYKKVIYRNSSADLVLLRQPLQKSASSSVRTYPVALSEIGIVTYNRGHQTLIEKLWDFYGVWTILFTCFILLTTFLVVWFAENRRTAFALFEIIRLLINHNLYTQMNTLPLRIFFGTIFIYFLIIQATFSGHLAKFLTKPQLRKHAETLGDLQELGYKSYDVINIKHYLSKTLGDERDGHSIGRACLNYIVYNDTSVACIYDYDILYKNVRNTENLYISKKSFGTVYDQFSVTRHWPLENRINIFFILFDALGFRKFITDSNLNNLVHNKTVVEARSYRNYRPITLENLTFSFFVLAIGLTSAAFSLCIEIYIGRQFNMISRSKNKLRKVITNRRFIDVRKLLVPRELKVPKEFRRP